MCTEGTRYTLWLTTYADVIEITTFSAAAHRISREVHNYVIIPHIVIVILGRKLRKCH